MVYTCIYLPFAGWMVVQIEESEDWIYIYMSYNTKRSGRNFQNFWMTSEWKERYRFL